MSARRTLLFVLAMVAGLERLSASSTWAAEPSQSALIEAVRARETAFAKTMNDRDLEAFAAYVSRDAVFIGGGQPLRGRAAVRAAWAPYFKEAKAPFSWKPEQVQVSGDGKLAITMGPTFAADGKLMGHFNSTWRLERDGQWRVVLDNGWDACKDAAPIAN